MSHLPTFIYVISMPYSGSTLLTMLMNAHPEITTVGVMTGPVKRDPDTTVCSCRKTVSQCEFWQSVAQTMRARGYEFELANFDLRFDLAFWPAVRRVLTGHLWNARLERLRDDFLEHLPSQTRHYRRVGERNRAFVEAVLEVTGKRVFVDSAKVMTRALHLHRTLDMDVRVIHLVRDVRGWVNSRLRHNEKQGRPGGDVARLARRWVNKNLAFQRQLGVLPSAKRLQVNYEDICRDLPSSMAEIFRFSSVEPNEDLSNWRSVPHHLLGNQMRLNDTSEVRLDERWKRMLTAEQLEAVDRVAGRLNRSLGNEQGYSPPVARASSAVERS